MKKVHLIDGSNANDYYLASEVDAELAALRVRQERLEADLQSAPNPYPDDFELSRYKGWYVTDRTHNLPARFLKANKTQPAEAATLQESETK